MQNRSFSVIRLDSETKDFFPYNLAPQSVTLSLKEKKLKNFPKDFYFVK